MSVRRTLRWCGLFAGLFAFVMSPVVLESYLEVLNFSLLETVVLVMFTSHVGGIALLFAGRASANVMQGRREPRGGNAREVPKQFVPDSYQGLPRIETEEQKRDEGSERWLPGIDPETRSFVFE
jgi:hypothetical protein